MHHTSAADLKFLQRLPRARVRNFKSKSGTRIIELLVPPLFPKFVSECAEVYHELRKLGTSPDHFGRRRSISRLMRLRRGLGAMERG